MAVAELTAIVRADTAQFTAGMDKAALSMAKAKTEAEAFRKTASTAFIAIGAVAVIGLAKAVDSTVKWGEATRSLQLITGQTAQSASQLLGVGEHLGINTQQLITGFGLLEKNIANVSPALAQYNIHVKDANGNMLPFDTVLGNVADKFTHLATSGEKTAFAMNVFGRSGKSLIPLLKDGSAGIDQMKAEADKLGLTLSQGNVDAIHKLTLAQRTLAESWQGLAIQIGQSLIPAVTQLVQWLTNVVQFMGKIPAPIYDVVAAFAILTGAIGAWMKISLLIERTWAPVLTMLATKIGLLGADTVATEADTAATVAWGDAADAAAVSMVTLGSAALATGAAILGVIRASAGKALGAYWLGSIKETHTPDVGSTGSAANAASADKYLSAVRGGSLSQGEANAAAASLGLNTAAFQKAMAAGVSYTAMLKQMSSTGTDAATAIAAAHTTAAAQMSGAWSAAGVDFQADQATLVTASLGTSKKLHDATLAQIATDQKAWKSYAAGVTSTLTGMMTNNITTLVSGLKAGQQLTAAALQKTVNQSADQMKNFTNNVTTVAKAGFQNLANYLMTLPPQVAQVVAKGIRTGHDQLAQSMTDNINNAQKFGNSLTTAIVGPLNTISNVLKTIANQLAHKQIFQLDPNPALHAVQLITNAVNAIPSDVSIAVHMHKTGATYPAAGGLIPGFATGGIAAWNMNGLFSPRGTDTVPAMLTPGEFVLRREAVNRIGIGRLERMNLSGDAGGLGGGRGPLRIVGTLMTPFGPAEIDAMVTEKLNDRTALESAMRKMVAGRVR